MVIRYVVIACFAQCYTVYVLTNLLRCLSLDVSHSFTHLTEFMRLLDLATSDRNDARHVSVNGDTLLPEMFHSDAVIEDHKDKLLALYEKDRSLRTIEELCTYIDLLA